MTTSGTPPQTPGTGTLPEGAEPSPTDLLHDLLDALGHEMVASPRPPREIWWDCLAEVRTLRGALEHIASQRTITIDNPYGSFARDALEWRKR